MNLEPSAAHEIPDWIEDSDPGMPHPTIWFWSNGVVRSIEYKNLEGELHRIDGPARIEYRESGFKHKEAWYQNSQLYRPGPEPSWTNWQENGNLCSYG